MGGSGITITGIAIYLLELIFVVLLLVSIYKRRPELATPWLVFTIILFIVQVVLTIVEIVVVSVAIPSLQNPEDRDNATIGMVIIGVVTFFAIGLGLYFWFVVYSFWHEMKTTKGTGRKPLELSPSV